MRYAVTDQANVVQNIVLADPDFNPGPGLSLIADDAAKAQIGGSWNGSTFTAPPARVPTLEETARARLSELKAKGWGSLTQAEKTEASQRLLEALG